MAFKINVDKYAYSASPEEVSGNYAAELAKKLVTDESKARESAVNSLESRLESETSARVQMGQDISLDVDRKIGGLRSEQQAADSGLNADIVDLSRQLSTEISSRISGDNVIQTLLDGEASARVTKDNALDKRIDDEEFARRDACWQLEMGLDNLQSATESLSADLANEMKTRAAQDAELRTALNTEISEAVKTLRNEVDGKADKSTMEEELEHKADKSEVNSRFLLLWETLLILDTKITTPVTPLTTYAFEFMTTFNEEVRLAEASNISFTFGDGEYESDYTSGLSFDSGATPTAIDYTDSGILNWVGTDCSMSNGLSIFQPSANTHYDIVFYFNGRQFIGLVNGFVSSIEWQGALPGNEVV